MTTQVVGPDEAGVVRSAGCIRDDGVLVYPTETVYGVGGAASNPIVCERVRTLKGGAKNKPMLLLTDEWARVGDWFAETSDALQRLMEHHRTLPLTLLVTASECAPAPLVGSEGLIGVRRTSNQFCRALINLGDAPLLSTSANLAKEPAPAVFDDISSAILEGVDLAVDAGCPLTGVPSTIVRAEGTGVLIVREGAADVHKIHEIVG